MLLSEIVGRGNYPVFSRMADLNREIHIETVEYIREHAADYGIDITKWDILEVFGTGKGNHLKTDRRTINKIFKEVAKREGKEAAKGKPAVLSLDEISDVLNKKIQESASDSLELLRSYKRATLKYAKGYLDDYRKEMELVAIHAMQIKKASNQKVDVAAQVKEVMECGFWDFIGYEGGALIFRTKDDVVCHDRNHELGTNIKMNLGKYEARWRMERAALTVHPFQNNTIVEAAISHPHVHSGEICWGNASDLALDMVTNFEFDKALKLLANLLCDYCSENPHATLHTFLYQQVGNRAVEARKTGVKEDDIKQMFDGVGLDSDCYKQFIKDGEGCFTNVYDDSEEGTAAGLIDDDGNCTVCGDYYDDCLC